MVYCMPSASNQGWKMKFLACTAFYHNGICKLLVKMGSMAAKSQLRACRVVGAQGQQKFVCAPSDYNRSKKRNGCQDNFGDLPSGRRPGPLLPPLCTPLTRKVPGDELMKPKMTCCLFFVLLLGTCIIIIIIITRTNFEFLRI